MITTVLHKIYYINYQLFFLKRWSFKVKKFNIHNMILLNEEYLTDHDNERLKFRITI